ncbi:putative NAD(P)H nitroreductase YdjA [bacterium BMS3Bbin10]|nr:putative NAD(P)H nitroreductase YdjA [bacterium BMS3Bbin10]
MKPHDAASDANAPESGDRSPGLVELIMSRRSVSPKWLDQPGPTPGDIMRIIGAAITAPDHDALCPWRFLAISGPAREKLADVFAQAKRLRSPDAEEADIGRERERGRQAPLTLAVIARPVRDNPKVPVREQYVSVGAAIQNILLVCHALGFGAKTLSGAKVHDTCIRDALGVGPEEELIAFICVGTPQAPPKERPRPHIKNHFAEWTGAASKS